MKLVEIIILAVFCISELVIFSLLIYYSTAINSDATQIKVTLYAAAAAQLVHIILVGIQIKFDISKFKLKTSIWGAWFVLFMGFGGLAGLLGTSDIEVDESFNIAFAIAFAEMLISFTYSCCTCCADRPFAKFNEIQEEDQSPRDNEGVKILIH
mmetsp:Transcript_13360/g.25093  ORF Transcript_13360/g.25093 Transcript_13360/m.25093 type:complete len:154 (+) Transcript_13360:9822-10283(+)